MSEHTRQGSLKSYLFSVWDRLHDSSLQNRALRGGVYVIAGQAYTHVLRLAGNLVMTRLLVPEAFGLMLIVGLVITALNMLSDVGVRGALITKEDQIDDDFIDTAWTMMVVRGIILGGIVLLLAQPIASYYEIEQLAALIAVSAIGPMLRGFTSPYPILAEKGVLLGRVVLWQTVSSSIAMALALVWLMIAPSIWVLVFLGLLNHGIAAVASFVFFRSRWPRFSFHKESFKYIFGFGRWVVISTALTFLASQGDGLVVSHWLTTEQLGVFSIAAALYKLVITLIGKLNVGLLFPIYSEMRDSSVRDYARRIHKVKLAIFLAIGPIILIFATLGAELIEFLYDPRYHNAGGILEIVALGSVFYVAGSSLQMIPLSFGDSYRHMWLQFWQFATLLGAMLFGAWQDGFHGLVIGIAVAQALYYPVLRFGVAKYYKFGLLSDACFVAVMIALTLLGWEASSWPTIA